MQTLNQALLRAAEHEDCGVRILDRREQETWLSWPELYQRAGGVAGSLRALGVERQETVGVVFPTGAEFLVSFFALLLAGAVPVPLYPPVRLGRLAEYQARTARMLRAAGVRRVVADARLHRVLGESLAAADCRGYTLEEIGSATPLVESVDADSLGLVQFSSGTTMEPKPVALTHRALMAQAASLNSFWPDGPDVRHSGVSWLPLYHDMGLIGCVFTVLERPSTLTLIPPELFVARPAVWLRALSRSRATVSPAPNFAFALCTEKIRDEQLQGVDLSSWSVALCGAETVVANVLRRFAERFAPYGFDPAALTPVYGLSEAALAVTFSEIGRPFRSSWRTDGRANGGSRGRELVSVGRPLPGFAVEIRDDRGRSLAAGEEGRIWVRGPSLMREYLHQPQATARALRDGWLDTGDLGFVEAGELYVSGRAKDVIIVRGANHSPDEIEAVVSELPTVRIGGAAAASRLPEDTDREEIWLFVEPARGHHADSAEIVEQCRHRVLGDVGITLDHVVVLEAGSLPRTSSGKVRRRRALELHLAGELRPIRPPKASTAPPPSERSTRLGAGREGRADEE